MPAPTGHVAEGGAWTWLKAKAIRDPNAQRRTTTSRRAKRQSERASHLCGVQRAERQPPPQEVVSRATPTGRPSLRTPSPPTPGTRARSNKLLSHGRHIMRRGIAGASKRGFATGWRVLDEQSHGSPPCLAYHSLRARSDEFLSLRGFRFEMAALAEKKQRGHVARERSHVATGAPCSVLGDTWWHRRRFLWGR